MSVYPKVMEVLRLKSNFDPGPILDRSCIQEPGVPNTSAPALRDLKLGRPWCWNMGLSENVHLM